MQSQIAVTYRGPDVEGHSISLDDLLPSIQGFHTSLKIINNYYGYENQIELRLEEISDGSAILWLKAIWNDATPNAKLLALTTVAVPVITIVTSQLVNVIDFKKHLMGLPSSNIEYSGNDITVYNINNSPITISPATLELSQDENLSKSLNKYVQPLYEGKIDETSFEVKDNLEKISESTISVEEKLSFSEIDNTSVKIEQVKLRGKLLSLNKQRNSGSFLIEGGKSIRYRFSSDTPESMYYDFAYNGVVEVFGLAKFNAEEKIISIEVFKVEKLQQELFVANSN